MRRKLWIACSTVIMLAAGLAAAIAVGAGETTGTNVSCATATAPAHTVAVDGTGVNTIPAVSTSACHTETYTIPTSTTTITQSSTTSTSTTTTTPTTTPATTTTPTTTPTTTSTTSTTSGGGARWTPPQHLRWYWQLQGTVPVKANIDATDFDGFDNTAATVASFHAAGQKAICYIDVGTAENFRSDYSSFPAGLLGSTNGWPGERWVNTSPAGPYYSTLQAIMTARFKTCAQKGFDAVEPDNMDGSENTTGFKISNAQQIVYDTWVANTVHSLGMAVFQKNFIDQSASLQPSFDGLLTEQCLQYSECSSGDTYTQAGKPFLDAEYSGSCPTNPGQPMIALLPLALDGTKFTPCWT